MELPLFDEVADAVRGLVPEELGPVRYSSRRHGIKLWFGAESAPREHYEAQVISAQGVADAEVLALEIGFHAEYPKAHDSQQALGHLLAAEKRWRPRVGREAVAGPFLGRADQWRRLSETWPDPDLADPELPGEIALRLVDYILALEPERRKAGR